MYRTDDHGKVAGGLGLGLGWTWIYIHTTIHTYIHTECQGVYHDGRFLYSRACGKGNVNYTLFRELLPSCKSRIGESCILPPSPSSEAGSSCCSGSDWAARSRCSPQVHSQVYWHYSPLHRPLFPLLLLLAKDWGPTATLLHLQARLWRTSKRNVVRGSQAYDP